MLSENERPDEEAWREKKSSRNLILMILNRSNAVYEKSYVKK